MKNRFIMLFIVIILLFSCKSAQTEVDITPVEPDLLISVKDNHAIIIFKYVPGSKISRERNNFILSVKTITLNVYYKNKILYKNLPIKLIGNAKSPEIITDIPNDLNGALYLDLAANINKQDLSFEFIINTFDKSYKFVKSYADIPVYTENDESIPKIAISPFLKINKDSLAVFGLEALRFKSISDEYLPTSENLRLQIFSEKGNLEYSSNLKKNFMQVIGQVLPEKICDTHLYTFEWNGIKNDGKKLKPGIYKANITIPSKPEPYFTVFNFRWK